MDIKYGYLIQDWPNYYKKNTYYVLELVGPNSYALPFSAQIISPEELFAVPEEFLNIVNFDVQNIPGLDIILVKKVGGHIT